MVKHEIDDVLELVRDGQSYREIARRYGVAASTICNWLSATPEIAEQSARAILASAEAWLDRGLEELEASDNDGATRARYIAQECARRAGIRNMHYRERMSVDAKVDVAVTFPRIINVIAGKTESES